MPSKKPMACAVLEQAIYDKLMYFQAKARRGSTSEFCALLLGYAITKLEEAGTLDALLDSIEPGQTNKLAAVAGGKRRAAK